MTIAALLIVAATFSTDLDGALMRLPAWMQTMTIPAADTFGTVEHAKYGTRRVTRNAVAAVIAAPAAFYERAYYASEGASNVWDTQQYGPVGPSADAFSHEFDAGPFYVSHSTNDPPLTVTNTLRLVEHDNIVRAFEDGMSSLIDNREDGMLPLARPSWDSDVRRVFWSHTDMPESVEPKALDWTHVGTFVDNRVQQWFVPLAACAEVNDALHDSAFTPSPGDRKDAVVRQFLRDITFGEAGGAEYDLDAMIPETGYGWYTNGVRDVISKSFGTPGDTRYGYRVESETLRLMPDDYTDVKTSYQRIPVREFAVKIYDDPWMPWNDLTKDYLFLNYPGYNELEAIFYAAEFRRPAAFEPFGDCRIEAAFPTEYGDPQLFRFFTFTLPDLPENADTVVFEGSSAMAQLDVESSNHWQTIEGTYIKSANWYDNWEPNEMTMTAYETVFVTNSIERRATDIAGACRAAAVMDRTFELPQKRETYLAATNYYVSGCGSLTNTPKTVKVTKVELKRVGMLPDVGDWVEVEYTFGEGEDYGLPNVKEHDLDVNVQGDSSLYPAERDVVHFEGSYLMLNSFDALAAEDYQIIFTNSVDATELVPIVMLPPGGEYRRVDFGTYGGNLESDFQLYHLSRVWIDGDEPTHFRIPIDGLVASWMAEFLTNMQFRVVVRANVSGEYSLHVTDPLDANTARELYAFAGPSSSCFATGRAKRSSVMCAGGCIVDYVKPDYERGRGRWPDISSPMRLDEYEYSPIDIFIQARKYATFDERRFSSALGWVGELVKARSETRQKCLSELSNVAGVDLGNLSSAIRVTSGMLTGGRVRGETMTLTSGPSVWSVPPAGTYYARNNGGSVEINTKPDGSGTRVDRLDYYMRFGSVGGPPMFADSLPIDDQKVDEGYEKRPFAANGKASAVITTDWKWKALGIED